MAEEQQQPAMNKLPIPRLPTTAYTAKTIKRNKTEDEKQAKKRECDRVRSKTRIYIGAAFERWRELRELKGFKTDEELAKFLLDGYHAGFLSATSTTTKRGRSTHPAPLRYYWQVALS